MAYNQALKSGLLNGAKAIVYKALYLNPCSTGSELFKVIKSSNISSSGSTTSNITTRLGELRSMGAAEELGSRKCKVTGQTVTVWKISEGPIKPLPKRQSKDKKIRNVKYDIRDFIDVVNNRTSSLTRRMIVQKLEQFANDLGEI